MVKKVTPTFAPEGGDTPNVETETQETKRTPRGAGAPRLSDFMEQFATSAALTADAEKFIEAVQKDLSQKPEGLKYQMLNESSVAVVGWFNPEKTQCYLTLFVDGVTSGDEQLPFSEMINEIAKPLIDDDIAVLDYVILDAVDFGKATIMAQHITKVFKMYNIGDDEGNVYSLLSSGRFRVKRNRAKCSQLIKTWDPHGVAPRDDIGIVVYFNDSDDFDRRGDDLEGYSPILAIPGYTRTIPVGGEYADDMATSQQRFEPLVLASGIYSPFPSKMMAAIALPIAAYAWISTGGWVEPYLRWDGNVNIGNLIDDEDGKPWDCPNRQQFDTFCQTYLSRPFFGVEVVEGRARIPGIDDLAFLPEKFKKFLYDFINYDSDKPYDEFEDEALVTNMAVEYIGTVDNEDSRNLDYLDAVANGTSPDLAQELLFIPEDETHRGRYLAESYNYATRWTNFICVLNANIINEIAEAMGEIMNIKWDDGIAGRNSAIGSLSGSGMNDFTGVRVLSRNRSRGNSRIGRRSSFRRR